MAPKTAIMILNEWIQAMNGSKIPNWTLRWSEENTGTALQPQFEITCTVTRPNPEVPERNKEISGNE
jgi:hypothetical protein